MSLDRRGQSLVMFVLVIPIIILVLVSIFDVGNAIYEKNRLSNTNYLAINYALDNMGSINRDDIIDYILSNTDNISNYEVILDNDRVEIEINKEVHGIVSENINLINVKSRYTGTIRDNKKDIERIKWFKWQGKLLVFLRLMVG